jgi:hypothetical protein
MTDPGAARGNQTYPPQRGPCTCGQSHVEIAHELRSDGTRGRCTVTDEWGKCRCASYEEVRPMVTGRELLHRSVAHVLDEVAKQVGAGKSKHDGVVLDWASRRLSEIVCARAWEDDDAWAERILSQRDAALEAIARVRALHKPLGDGEPKFCSNWDGTWPCATVRALDGDMAK